MKIPDLYDDLEIERRLHIQQERAWDLENDFPWRGGTDLNKPFVALDEKALLFPGISQEQRLVLSQYMGLVVACVFSEFENILTRLKKAAWEQPIAKYPVSPEMIDFGEEFFIEEYKHSQAFERYLQIFADEVNVSYEELLSILPQYNYAHLDQLYRVNALLGGVGVWWIAAAVEEMSILVYLDLHRYKEELDPLYYTLHRRHFEEEARHACFAFMMLDLLFTRNKRMVSKILRSYDFVLSQMVSMQWLMQELLLRVPTILLYRNRHPFFQTLSGLMPHISTPNPIKIMQELFTSTPYFSMLMNPASYPRIRKTLDTYHLPRLFSNRRQTNELVSMFA